MTFSLMISQGSISLLLLLPLKALYFVFFIAHYIIFIGRQNCVTVSSVDELMVGIMITESNQTM